MKITFTVYGEPKPKGRPRFCKIGSFVRAYTPKETERAEQDLRAQAIQHRPPEPFTGAIVLEARMFRGIPKSFSKKKAELAEQGAIHPTTKPDSDNYLKLLCDAFNSIFWRDDSQIVRMTVSKHYSNQPRIEVFMEEI